MLFKMLFASEPILFFLFALASTPFQQKIEAVARRINTGDTPKPVVPYGALSDEIREEAERQDYPAEDVRVLSHCSLPGGEKA